MDSVFRERLHDFIKLDELISPDDPLCSVDGKQVQFYEEGRTTSAAVYSLVSLAKKTEKETGINPLCIAEGVASIKKNNVFLKVPIIIQEINCNTSSEYVQIDKLGEPFLNPFLVHLFGRKNFQEISTIETFLKRKPQEILTEPTKTFIGNFHPYRYELIRDIEEIEGVFTISQNLARLLLLDTKENEEVIFGDYSPIIDSDYDQRETIEKFKRQSLLVQGPPGTGKSQLIVNAIGIGLHEKKTILLSSEKKSALDAVYFRLKSLGLHHLSLLNFAKNEQKLIVSDLKKTWDFFQNSSRHEVTKSICFFPYEDIINTIIEKISTNKCHMDILFEKLKDFKNETIYSFDFGAYSFDDIYPQINQLNPELYPLLAKTNLLNSNISDIIEQEITKTKFQLHKLNDFLPVKTKKDLDTLIVKLFKIQHFTSHFYTSYGEIIAKKSVKLTKLYSTGLTLENDEKIWFESLQHWIKRPSRSELNLLKTLSYQHGFFNRLKFNRIWKKWVRTPELSTETTLASMERFFAFEEKKNKFQLALSQLGIDNLHTLKSIHQLALQHNDEDWSWFKSLKAHQLLEYKTIHPIIQQLKIGVQDVFQFQETDDIYVYLNQLLTNIEPLKQQLKLTDSFPPDIKRVFVNCSTYNDFKLSIYHAYWRKLTSNALFPKKNERVDWLTSALRYQRNNKENQRYTAKELIETSKISFQTYHDLILSSPSKLSAEKKIFRNQLKKGKTILVKEFSKKKNFMSLRGLYESDARHWLILLKPILMMHPQRISTYFPPEPGLFDIAIIDEASQMPFSHSIGTLQRAKRLLIAGDDQQMEPSSFFKIQSENDCSVFHQAKYHFENVSLTHHYRSEHKQLIEFSNQNFYFNKLRCISNAKITSKNCLQHHYIPNGMYNEGVNTIEAKEIANYYSQLPTLDDKIGIVAFSEQQLTCIKNELISSGSVSLSDIEEGNQLVLKTLDQVQGDEFDTLIVSFGYGKNKFGEFDMRFGPINHTGGSKRLNVLFTRAKKEIHFFSSVKRKDFPTTKNESVVLLIKWFDFLENQHRENPQIHEIEVFSILQQAKNAFDFTHLVSLYEQRVWKIIP